MSDTEIYLWILTNDPHAKLTDAQREIVRAALRREDTKKAKQCLIDWKISTN